MALQLTSQSNQVSLDHSDRPCSGPSRIQCSVRFINHANCRVDVYWISRKGRQSLYRILQPNKAMVVNTFAGHLWHFCNVNGVQIEWLQANQEFIYNVQELNDSHGRPVVQDIIITLPLYSLQDWCKRLIIKQVKRDDIQHLQLPNMMKEALHLFTTHSNLISEQLKDMDSSCLVRKRREQLIHLSSHLIRGMFIRQTFTQLSPILGTWLQNINQVDNMNQLQDMFGILGHALDDNDSAEGQGSSDEIVISRQIAAYDIELGSGGANGASSEPESTAAEGQWQDQNSIAEGEREERYYNGDTDTTDTSHVVNDVNDVNEALCQSEQSNLNSERRSVIVMAGSSRSADIGRLRYLEDSHEDSQSSQIESLDGLREFGPQQQSPMDLSSRTRTVQSPRSCTSRPSTSNGYMNGSDYNDYYNDDDEPLPKCPKLSNE